MWVGFGDTPWIELERSLATIPGDMELFFVPVCLAAISVVLGGWLTIRAKVSVLVLGAGIIVAIAAIWWNIIAMIFWLVPLPFMWLAYKSKNDA